MAEPMFKVGDLVRLQARVASEPAAAFMARIAHDRPAGLYEVTRVLPELNGQHQYRIRCAADGRERIALESELAPAVRTPQPRR